MIVALTILGSILIISFSIHHSGDVQFEGKLMDEGRESSGAEERNIRPIVL